MSDSSKSQLEAERTVSTTGRPLPARERVLEVACELFAQAGFHGTHLREICERAGTNIAGVCYYFQSKEGLYQAVMMEAGRQLSDLDTGFVTATDLNPEERLFALTESLLRRLGSRRAWIAKLLARELVDCPTRGHSYAASHLERDFVLLQAAMRSFLEFQEYREAIRLHAVTLIGECVHYSLAAANPQHPLNQLATLPSTRTLARFLARRSIKALHQESTQTEV